MAVRLAANVVLLDADGFTPVLFHAGTPKTEVPAWAQERITNPGVWEGEDGKPAASSTTKATSPEAKPASKPRKAAQ